MHEVPKHLQKGDSRILTQKQAMAEYRKSLTPEKKAAIRKEKKEEKERDKKHWENVKKSKAAMARREKESKKPKKLTFPGYESLKRG